jgi:ABC-2 type transport system permease protein
MIHTMRRLAITERNRFLMIAAAVSLFMLMMVVVYDQIGTSSFKGMENVDSIAKGFDIRAFTSPHSVFANLIGIAIIHPLFLAMIGSIAIALGARSCAGELHDGTIELTLARPLSRRRYLVSYLAFNATAVAALLAAAFVTVPLVAIAIDSSGRLSASELFNTGVEAWIFFVCFATIATLISTVVRSRSAATTASIAVLVGTYFLEFFAKLWSPMEPFGYLSPFHYFIPTDTLLGQGIQWTDVAVLATISVVASALAVELFQRGDLA